MNNYLSIKYLKLAPINYIAMILCGLGILFFIGSFAITNIIGIATLKTNIMAICFAIVESLLVILNVICLKINETN